MLYCIFLKKSKFYNWWSNCMCFVKKSLLLNAKSHKLHGNGFGILGLLTWAPALPFTSLQIFWLTSILTSDKTFWLISELTSLRLSSLKIFETSWSSTIFSSFNSTFISSSPLIDSLESTKLGFEIKIFNSYLLFILVILAVVLLCLYNAVIWVYDFWRT